MSFLPHYCHSFRITVIPSVLLSFLPDYCHSFCISVIPSKLLPFQIFVILNSFNTLPYPKGEKNGHRRWPYMRVKLNKCTNSTIRYLLHEKSYILPSHLMYGKSGRFSFSSLLFFDKVLVKSPVVDSDIWAGLGRLGRV